MNSAVKFGAALTLVFQFNFTAAAQEANGIGALKKDPLKTKEEQILKQVEETKEKIGVKVGMSKEQVMKLMGDKFTEEKVNGLEADGKVYTWKLPEEDYVTVTFDGEKVKAVSHRMHSEAKED